ncbi:MAG TPA: contractile injection system protein, VgrG/Pvc8 family [Burkholderiaceae bacterium]|nr:contractile injection system protein, VgrG/Pvc8 family [Burkholderiaceae bacterium]
MGENLLSTLALYSAKPTVRVDGQQHALLDTLLQSMTMHEDEGGLSSLELGFVNWATQSNASAGLAFEDEKIFKLGGEIKTYAGESMAPTEIFAGRISAFEFAADAEGPPRLIVHAEDAAMRARLSRRSAVYENKSVADIAKDIASRLGLTPKVTGLSDTAKVHVQLNESDLAFLRRLLVRHGADVQLVGNELHVSPRADVQRNAIELRMNSQLVRVRVMADLAHQVTQARVTGFDPSSGEAVSGDGDGAPLGPGAGRTGKDLVNQVFGDRVEQVAHRLALTQSEANALAEAEFAHRARAFVRVQGECTGVPTLRVGSHLTLKDVSPRFDNTYYATAVTHRYDQVRGYTTEFRAECAYFGNPA